MFHMVDLDTYQIYFFSSIEQCLEAGEFLKEYVIYDKNGNLLSINK